MIDLQALDYARYAEQVRHNPAWLRVQRELDATWAGELQECPDPVKREEARQKRFALRDVDAALRGLVQAAGMEVVG